MGREARVVVALVQVPPVAQAESAEVAGAVPVVERGRDRVVPEAGAEWVEAGPAALAAVQVGMGLAGELEPAAVAVLERALVVVAPEAAAQVAVGTEVVEEQERAAEAEGLGPAGELEVQAGKAQRRENG